MRSSWNRDLAAFILLLVVFRSPAFAERARAKPVPKPVTKVYGVKVEGYGLSETDAKLRALEKLSTKVTEYLNAARPDITYTPGPNEIESLHHEFSAPEPWTPPPDSDLPLDKGQWLKVELRAELTSADVQSFEAETRNQLSQHRQALLARGLAGAVALLAVGTGYFKLEEKVGRHKKKLGVAAVSVLAIVGLTLLAWGFDYF